MTLEEQYEGLLKREQEKKILIFLQTLNDDQRKALAPHIKKLFKEYYKIEQVGNNYKSKATACHRTILSYSAFVCYNRKDFEKENSSWIISKEHLDKILHWYFPSWLGEYINGLGKKGWLPYQLTYDYLIELTEKGFLQPQSNTIARLLPAIIYEYKNEVVNKRHVHNTYFKPENVLKHSITLEEHIWYLFEHESNVNYTNQWIHFEGREQNLDAGWIYVFKKYVAEGKIDRQRLLQETLLATNRNFNKNLSGWFADLFVQLQPESKELVSLQAELFSLFSSPHSKVVNTSLQSYKAVINETDFDVDAFLDYVPVLLASDTKTVVSSTLQLLEKLAKNDADKGTKIALLATAAFIHKDDSLQTKAAKLVQKFGTTENHELRETLALYRESLYSNSRQLLQSFLINDTDETKAKITAPAPEVNHKMWQLDNPLPSITDVDDLVFLISQAFDNNQTYHVDLVPAALIRLHKQITEKQIAKLEPAFQRAFKLFYGDWRSHIGQLDQLLAYLVLDYGVLLMQQYPESVASVFDLYGGFMEKIESNKKMWAAHKPNIGFMSGWKGGVGEVLYDPYKSFFKMVFERLKVNQDAPLLCTPTHAPAWIDPKILVERIYYYQQHQIVPDSTDYQIALSRCWLHHTEDALAFVHQKLTGEEKELLLFLLDPAARPQGPFITEWAWMMASLSKSPDVVYTEFENFGYQHIPRERFTGQYAWKTFVEDYYQDKYSWENGNYRTEKVPAKRKALMLDAPLENVPEKKENGIKHFFTKLIAAPKQKAAPPEPLLYDFFHIKGDFFATEHNDIKRIMMLTPNNPEPIVALAIRKCLSDPSFSGETNKRFVIAVLQGLHSIWKPPGKMAHLFIATCMISSDKTVTSYAAEIWIRSVTENSIISELIGAILGKHESIEFAPLKRFTDLILNQLLGISSTHNQALEKLLIAMLKELPAEPIKNLKKLLEIYFEVTAINHSSVEDSELKSLLQTWKKNTGLSKVIKTIA